MKYIPYILLLVFFCQSNTVMTQVSPKKLIKSKNSGLSPKIGTQRDSSKTKKIDNAQLLSKVKISKDTLNAPIDYSGDFQRLDNVNKQLILVGNAAVKYQSLNLKADSIIFDLKNNIVTAMGRRDSTGLLKGLPEFENGDEKFSAVKIRYNFQTQKGKIYDVRTKQNDLFLLGGSVRYESKAIRKDTSANDVAYGADALITTCNAAHPHFGIRSSKLKIIPDKLVVVGPSRLEIADIPLPIGLPFGFFPITQGQRNGVIFPRDYEFSPQLGFGIRNIGYYMGFGDNFETYLTGDVYTRGTWRVRAVTNYKKRYKYNGGLTLEYGINVSDPITSEYPTKSKTFLINWSHRQDNRAHPSQNFGGRVNISINDALSQNYNDAQSVLNTQLSSNLTYTKRFPGRPFNLSTSFNHSQNTRTGQMTITFPSVNFNMNRIYPFKRKVTKGGKEAWFEKIGVDYRFNAKATATNQDSVFFSKETVDLIEYGAQHQTTMNASFRVLKYFNLTPSVNYSEKWFFDTENRYFDSSPELDTTYLYNSDSTDIITVIDTLNYGNVVDERVNGFRPLREFSAALTLGTKIFGTAQFNKGFIRGLRHVMTPSVSIGYTPDYTDPAFDYFRMVDTDSRDEYNDPQEYSVFSQGIYSGPSNGGSRMALSYGLRNTFEAKYFSKKDSLNPIKKVKLFDNINISGNYNFQADSLNFSPVGISGTARILKGVSTLSLSARFDPYAAEENATGTLIRVNKFNWDENKQLLRFDNFRATLNTRFTLSQVRKWLGLKEGKNNTRGSSGNGQNQFGGQNVNDNASNFGRRENDFGGDRNNNSSSSSNSLLQSLSISHQFVFQTIYEDGKHKTEVSSNSLSLRGTLNISEKWRITLSQISYDFKRKRLVYPDVQFYRDLHCWEMGMSWQPERGTYSFFLRVKPSSLDFLNIPYRRNNVDARF